jgi:predicted HTH transcriptional regulator
LLLLWAQERLGFFREKEGGAMSITEETRRESYHAVLETLTERQKAVLQVLKERGDLTAQETAAELHRRRLTPADERNFAAPRLTELCEMGLVAAVGKKKCYKTGRNVTVWSATQPEDAEMRVWLDSLERGGGKGGRSS